METIKYRMFNNDIENATWEIKTKIAVKFVNTYLSVKKIHVYTSATCIVLPVHLICCLICLFIDVYL